MKISGHMDLCSPTLIEGWIYSDGWDGQPIRMQVYIGDLLIGECAAERYRSDLQEAGFGDGRCGFSFTVPVDLDVADTSSVRLRLIDTPVYLLPDEFTVFADREISMSGSEM